MKFFGNALGTVADVVDLGYTGYQEYTKDPSLSEDKKAVNTGVEVAIKGTSILAQIGASAAIGAVAGSVVPGLGTALGTVVGIGIGIATIFATAKIDDGIDALTHDVSVNDRGQSIADVTKNFVYDLINKKD